MATIKTLKRALRQKFEATSSSSKKQPLSDEQYNAGFNVLVQNSGWMIYQNFIIPQLSQLLEPLFSSRVQISVLEIGPGSRSILGRLPQHLRRKICKFTGLEPNSLYAARLEEWLCPASGSEPPLPCLRSPPSIRRTQFDLEESMGNGTDTGMGNSHEKYDVVLFCHSMYGMKPKSKFIELALTKLVKQPPGGMVVVFHRGEVLSFDGLTCHQTASFTTGEVSVTDNDDELDSFAAFIAGFVTQDADMDKAIRIQWRKACRALGSRKEVDPERLVFSSPDIMATFTQHATALPELMEQVPAAIGHMAVKNREARLHRPASIIKPTEVLHIQQCIRWALNHGSALTVIGGGHSGHCLWSNVVSVDMSAFDQVHIHMAEENGKDSTRGSSIGSLIVAEAGCKTGDIIRRAMSAGLTVPLGARPSVGAGLWLQGGIGHLARLHGLACDAIVGAVMVSVSSGQILCIGIVPSQHQPASVIRPENEQDLLWAMKGSGTNFGIVVSVTFRAYTVPTFLTRNWIFPLNDSLEAQLKLGEFDEFVSGNLPWNNSADAYIYWNSGQLHLGVTMFESSTTSIISTTPTAAAAHKLWGPENDSGLVDSIGLFESEMYISGMHGGHSGGKTSSFKRCLFLKNIGEANVAQRLIAAIETRPSPLCYLHLLQGGGAVGEVAANATAFGCRDWDFACVITGVWPRDQDGSEAARSAIEWVYNLAENLLPLSRGVYGADLGPDPRDAALAARAFGPNRPRLARLKQSLDPHNVLAYACPLPKAPVEPKLIVLVTGESCAGKDHCAEVWASVFSEWTRKGLTARVVSISSAIKRDYAAAVGADLGALLCSRAYKEQHRPVLTKFFQERVRQEPRLPEKQFLDVVSDAVDEDVLFITGMRDEAPIAAFWHLVPHIRLLEVHVRAREEVRRARRGCHNGCNGDWKDSNSSRSNMAPSNYRPSFIFDNDVPGDDAAKKFAENNLLPFLHEDLERLASMARPVPDFPQPGIEFRHVLGIAQQPGGLRLCASLLQTHFSGDWTKVDAVACCEAGGFVYASALALQVNVPLVLIREAGKLPQPTESIIKPQSHISSLVSDNSKEKRFEVELGLVSPEASVVVVDDVLATGETLCAILQLLAEVGAKDFGIMAVAEFPAHRGRELLRQRGFGDINVQSLLIFGGA